MKIKIFILLFLNITLCKSQIVTVSSPSLKNWIISSTENNSRAKDLNGNWLKIDQNDDGELQLSEALNISYFLDVNGNTSSYDCIQSFTNLEELSCENNGWTVGMNLSNLSHLKKLTLRYNNTTFLNIGGCVNLEELVVSSNALTTLNLSGLNNLIKLDCGYNYLNSLNFSQTPNLKYLSCTRNNLYTLNLTNLTSLETLLCGTNNLKDLSINNNLNLKSLDCQSNYLTSLNVSNQTLLETLSCGYNYLGTLNLSNCTNLVSLNCYSTGLNSLNTNNLSHLETLLCFDNYISNLNLINNPNLKTIWCYNNNFESNSLNLTNQSVLETLLCQSNNLTTLDISNCSNLSTLYCYNNNLTTLDISNCPNLSILNFYSNTNLVNLNINNGFDWAPNYNFFGDGLANISQICTSTNSIPDIQGFYNFHNLYPSVTNCNVLNVLSNSLLINKMSISPNPAQGEVVFSQMVYSVSINDINGRLIKTSVVNGTKMDISELKQGMYMLNIENENGFISTKLIVE